MHVDGLAFAFTALREPRTQAFREAFRGEAVAGFDFAGSDGERVIKVGRVGEIAHAKLIEPFERASAGFAADDHVDVEFLHVHTRKVIRDAAIRPAS